MRVAMFSGGRGAAGIARALLRVPGLELSLLINGYDNGLSTGALRRYLPGMLGPSDFRKNLLLHLGRDDPRRALLEHRLPPGSTLADLERIVANLAGSGAAAEPVARDLRVFAARLAADPGGFDLSDCALGNLVFAGAYLRLGEDFNAAVRACARTFASPARLLNVTDGANAYLVALKQDGRVLADEAEIVGPQDAAAITDLFLLPAPLTRRELAALAGLPAARVRDLLGRRSVPAAPDPEALRALAESDLVVYGPGTPHSSLLPSYLTRGVADAIAGGRSAARVFVVNVGGDHDVQGLTATDLVDRALAYLGDPGNERRTITHVLSHHGPAGAGGGAGGGASGGAGSGPVVPRAVAERGTWAGARWIGADLEDPCRPGAHHGPRTAAALRALLGETPLARAG
ncbi:2-phospho-L-lactate transferase CofD family protein [Actinomadura sp. ATCC 31491]|uniref:2-phospho-L-lactate transferase CofD family protein n=1 Tax=Actinomadura luzonensis TaxID=2805427 RepID=A0ABT0FXU2_9ACTN|nr:2-phospho-L-lactate transferase CofD family protein [Actinomadura luzonensis]MCK2216978.1 2-phospho-L-lactate transferase CofD family protein [Actinomadura luzonensis]